MLSLCLWCGNVPYLGVHLLVGYLYVNTNKRTYIKNSILVSKSHNFFSRKLSIIYSIELIFCLAEYYQSSPNWISVITLITDFSDITIWSKLCRISGWQRTIIIIHLSIKVPTIISILSWDNVFPFWVTCYGIWPLKVHQNSSCFCQK